MRTILIVFVLFLTGCRSMVGAQEIREVDGQKYIAHTVLKGQTLYAISRHYAVQVEAITQANPAAAQGLSLGQVLLIPVKAQVKKELKVAPAFVEGDLAHTVAKKETLFGIAHNVALQFGTPIAGVGFGRTGVEETPFCKSTHVKSAHAKDFVGIDPICEYE